MKTTITKSPMLLLFLLTLQSISAQSDSLVLKGHENLVGGVWKASGKWTDGTPFEQAVMYSWSLGRRVLRTQTLSLEDSANGEPQVRNEGFRFYDPSSDGLCFIELDIQGGVTHGVIIYDAKNIYYRYPYGSGENQLQLTDAWEYKNDDTYAYTVGIFENGEWKQKFLSTEMKRYKE